MRPQIIAVENASDALENQFATYQALVRKYTASYERQDWSIASRAYGTLKDYRCTISKTRSSIAEAVNALDRGSVAILARLERQVRDALGAHQLLSKTHRHVSCKFMPAWMLGSEAPFMHKTARWSKYTQQCRDDDMQLWFVCHKNVLKPLMPELGEISQTLFPSEEDEEMESDVPFHAMALAILASAIVTIFIIGATVAVLTEMFSSAIMQLILPNFEPFLSVNFLFVIICYLINYIPDNIKSFPHFSEFTDFLAVDTKDEINWASASGLMDSIGSWRRPCKLLRVSRHKDLTVFPTPPAYDCKSSNCTADRDSRALKETCPCGLQLAFLLAKDMNLKRERNIWHSDRFSACKGDQRWKAKADEVFKVVNGMLQGNLRARDPEIRKGVDEWRKASGKLHRSSRRSSK